MFLLLAAINANGPKNTELIWISVILQQLHAYKKSSIGIEQDECWQAQNVLIFVAWTEYSLHKDHEAIFITVRLRDIFRLNKL